jgi:hypothetical protein
LESYGSTSAVKKQVVFIFASGRGAMAGCGGDYAITQKPLKKPVAVIA